MGAARAPRPLLRCSDRGTDHQLCECTDIGNAMMLPLPCATGLRCVKQQPMIGCAQPATRHCVNHNLRLGLSQCAILVRGRHVFGGRRKVRQALAATERIELEFDLLSCLVPRSSSTYSCQPDCVAAGCATRAQNVGIHQGAVLQEQRLVARHVGGGTWRRG